jgi:hypothetical protein
MARQSGFVAPCAEMKAYMRDRSMPWFAKFRVLFRRVFPPRASTGTRRGQHRYRCMYGCTSVPVYQQCPGIPGLPRCSTRTRPRHIQRTWIPVMQSPLQTTTSSRKRSRDGLGDTGGFHNFITSTGRPKYRHVIQSRIPVHVPVSVCDM